MKNKKLIGMLLIGLHICLIHGSAQEKDEEQYNVIFTFPYFPTRNYDEGRKQKIDLYDDYGMEQQAELKRIARRKQNADSHRKAYAKKKTASQLMQEQLLALPEDEQANARQLQQQYKNRIKQNSEQKKNLYAQQKVAAQLTQEQLLVLSEDEQANARQLREQYDNYKKRKLEEVNKRNAQKKAAFQLVSLHNVE